MKKHIKLVGIIFLISVLLVNEYTIARLFTSDGIIGDSSGRYAIWGFDIFLFFLGLLMIIFKGKIEKHYKKIMYYIKTTVIIVLVSYILFFLVDVIYGYINPIKPWESELEIAAKAAYETEPFYSHEFLLEKYAAMKPGEWNTPEGTRLIFKKEFYGKYINAEPAAFGSKNVVRRTINKYNYDDNDVIKVLMLGGSTMYCNDVPDNLTISSQLSEILNSSGKNKYFVINAGVDSANSSQELERLEFELKAGLKPDIVIGYHAYNDIVNGIYFNEPEGVMFDYESRNKVKEFISKVVPSNIYKRIRLESDKNSDNIRSVSEHMNDISKVKKLAVKTGEVFTDNNLKMYNLSVQYGFKYYCIVQPVGVYGNYPDSYEDAKRVHNWAKKYMPKIFLACDEGYAALRNSIESLKKQNVAAFDWSELFLNKKDNIFIDACHINSKGNKIVSDEMAKMILN
ncbi:SGNH/GDSL hydrolase family protein [Pseudobacteroides cellulosolvens]|uniref:Uncharacterized protein n=1 Tax=Pseudobacteroides cellulosolvens ATCC 35603 = DSM 2933 TaxID=398512 RepID=A0A0L6JK32_9FIRM|nr:SGNH/GDSL hydrolase family protein [Pseudobacteroides cellulosolvens]KNY25712.1 hypothetical protein Bccel_0972 [Pseudobacteroides cellulosolvens ATCC 35603 = DSM 2933]